MHFPQYVQSIISAIEDNGYSAYAVGGCVRDTVMGRTPHDYDVATSAPLSAVCEIFPRVIKTGERFGTVTVLCDGDSCEVTTYRTEGGYTDGRHPGYVLPADDIREDLSRRDFTINAMAFNPASGLLDIYGGREDIKRQIINTVGDPSERFNEDALRIMRCFRFAATLGFSIDDAVLRAAIDMSRGLVKISTERINIELFKTICSSNPDVIYPLLKSGALSHVGITAPHSDLSVLKKLPMKDYIRFAALCCECGVSSDEAALMLRCSNKIRKLADITQAEMCRVLPKTKSDIKRRLSKMPDLTKSEYADILSAAEIMRGGKAFAADAVEEIFKNGEPYLIKHLSVSGEMLKELGISGKEIGKTLEKLLEIVIDDPSKNQCDVLMKEAVYVSQI